MRGNQQRCQSSAFDPGRAPSRISSTDRTARFLLGCQCQYNSARSLSRKRSVNSSFVSYKVADLLLFFCSSSPRQNLPRSWNGISEPMRPFCFTSSVKTHSFHRSQVGDARWYNVEHYLWRIDLSVLWKHSKMLLSMTHRREGKKKERRRGLSFFRRMKSCCSTRGGRPFDRTLVLMGRLTKPAVRFLFPPFFFFFDGLAGWSIDYDERERVHQAPALLGEVVWPATLIRPFQCYDSLLVYLKKNVIFLMVIDGGWSWSIFTTVGNWWWAWTAAAGTRSWMRVRVRAIWWLTGKRWISSLSQLKASCNIYIILFSLSRLPLSLLYLGCSTPDGWPIKDIQPQRTTTTRENTRARSHKTCTGPVHPPPLSFSSKSTPFSSSNFQ